MPTTTLKFFNFAALLTGLVLTANSAWSNPRALQGHWSHDNHQTQVKIEGRNQFLFCNEENVCARGFFVREGLVRVPSWNVEGLISERGNRISWSNNTSWVKHPRFPSRRTAISGPWNHNGRPTFIRMSADGIHFTLTNEEGKPSQGYINEKGELVLPNLQVKGQIGRYAKRIIWSNNTEWRRY